jgi:uncharacterized membrane protein YeaQ/YmgE (transglycosylase-associated protein family)
MTWTFTSLVIQIIAGLIGGHITAVAAHEHTFGTIGHTVTGLVGGFLSGYFLQTLAITMVTGTGSLTEPRPAEVFMVQALTGLASGAIVTLAVGFIKHTIDQHKGFKGVAQQRSNAETDSGKVSLRAPGPSGSACAGPVSS